MALRATAQGEAEVEAAATEAEVVTYLEKALSANRLDEILETGSVGSRGAPSAAGAATGVGGGGGGGQGDAAIDLTDAPAAVAEATLLHRERSMRRRAGPANAMISAAMRDLDAPPEQTDAYGTCLVM